MIVPRIIIAVGLFYLFARIGLVATDLGLVIGHTVLALPFTSSTITAVLKTYDWRLDQAAATLGANRVRTLSSSRFRSSRAGWSRLSYSPSSPPSTN